MDRTTRGGHHLVAAGVVLAMVGLIPIAMHATGAGYEAQGILAILVGVATASWGSRRERRAERQADLARACAQFGSVRTSPFDVRRPADIVTPRRRTVVASVRIDLDELGAAEFVQRSR